MNRCRRRKSALRERLARLSEASLRINESLDFDTVLQGVLDSARSLTEARYGVMTLLDDGGQVQDFLSSGLKAEESEQLWLMPDGLQLFQALTDISEPMRLPDLAEARPGHGLHPVHHPPAGWGIPLPVGAHVPPGRQSGPRLRGGQGKTGRSSPRLTRRPW